MSQAGTAFRKPNLFEQILNKGFRRLGGARHRAAPHYLLQVPGRKTGQLYSTRSICWRSRGSGTLLVYFSKIAVPWAIATKRHHFGACR
jgi:hypothetical protein